MVFAQSPLEYHEVDHCDAEQFVLHILDNIHALEVYPKIKH